MHAKVYSPPIIDAVCTLRILRFTKATATLQQSWQLPKRVVTTAPAEEANACLRVTASLTQAQQREQQLLLFSSRQPPLASQTVSSLRQQLRGDGRGRPEAALGMLPAVEVLFDGTEP